MTIIDPSNGGGEGYPPSMQPGDYPGGPSMSEQGKCCSERASTQIAIAMQQIVQVMNQIQVNVQRQVDYPCQKIDECIDYILYKIKQKVEKGTKSCKECQDLVKSGLGGTLEFAVACAHHAVSKCDEDLPKELKPCSAGDEGKPCKGCGKEPCCCHEGYCEPCPDEEKKKYIGWCNPSSGMVAVTKEDEPTPGSGFVQVGLTDTEQAAVDLARANCGKYEQQGSPPEEHYIAPTSPTLCQLSDYTTGVAAGRLASSQTAANILAGYGQSASAMGRLGLDGINFNNIGEVAVGIARIILGAPAFLANDLLRDVGGAIGCKSSEFSNGLLLLNALDSIGRATGADFSEWTADIRQTMHYSCRQLHLDPDKAIAAYLADAINYKSLDTLWGIQGICPQDVEQYVEAARSKPLPLQLAVMRHRQLISQSEYRTKMRQIGYLDPTEAERLFKLTYQVPTMTDIIRFMVRDADDDQLASQLRLDDFFQQKYGKQLKQWAQDQGIPDEVAKYHWRSHWTIPSPTQLFEFWHRLRKDQKFGGEQKLMADIKSALIQQDILPYWHDHYLAVSFNPLTRVDVRRAYNIGALKESDVEQSYIDLGYSDKNAKTLTDFTKRLKDESATSHKAIALWLRFAITRADAEQRMLKSGFDQQIVTQALDDVEIRFKSTEPVKAFIRGDLDKQGLTNELGNFGVSQQGIDKIARLAALQKVNHPSLQDYAVGMIDSVAAVNDMTTDGMNPDVANSLLSRVDRTIDRDFLVACQRGIKRRYLSGELDNQQAEQELIAKGTTGTRSARMVANWECEKASQNKQVQVSKICHWLSQGAITTQDFLSRMQKLGYDQTDANLLLMDCMASTNEQRRKEAERQAKQQLSDLQKAANAEAKAAATVRREQDRLAQARSKAAKLRQTREKQIMSAAEKLHDTCECELYTAILEVRDQKARIKRDYGLTDDEAIQVVLVATDSYSAPDLNEYATAVTLLALTAVAEKATVPEFATNGQA